MIPSLARFCYRRRGTVVLSWIGLLIALFIISNAFGEPFRTEFKLPGSESQAAGDILRANGFDSRTGSQARIVYKADNGVADPAVKGAIEGLLTQVAAKLPKATVSSPYTPQGARQVSPDGKIAYAEVDLAEGSQESYVDAGKEIRAVGDTVHVDGLALSYGGDMFANQNPPSNEAFGVIAAVIILMIAFGSILAMGLPIVTALFGVGCGIALVGLTTRIFAVPVFTTPTAAVLGIGVGIDYALLIVTRYRESLSSGMDPEHATVHAMNTAGRSVLFAGLTVVIAVLGMYFMNLDLMRAIATGAALAVLMTMFAALTLLPALLGFVGRKIDRFGIPGRKPKAGQAPRETFWHRWSRVIQRYPWPAMVGSVALLLVLSLPVLSMRLGFGDAGNRPTTDTTRQAYDLLSEGFGPGSNGPLIAAIETPGGTADQAALKTLGDRIAATENVAFVTPAQPSPNGKAAIITIIPRTSPQDAATSKLVNTLRDDVVPSATHGTDLTVKVGGVTAGAEDFATYTGSRMPIFFGAVLTLSFLLLMAVFRSILVPLKAVIVNLLSIGVAFGVMVAVFQWGWGDSLLGVGKEGPIEAWAPMMLFAIVFGLSMDYEVFLLSRIKEEYDRSHDNAQAVADGLASTARVISAAAAIMVCVFASFVLGEDRGLKLFGFGLAVAVFIDATVVRLVLVPATMELLGDRNWWLPGWLDRLIPTVHVEAADETARAGARGAEALTAAQD